MKIARKVLVAFVVSVATVAPVYSQAGKASADGETWEYLVVSFGKVYFSNPLTDPDSKSLGRSKLISFSEAGFIVAQEGMSVQRYMDTLGKFGWELVGVVGAIGGDQEMLFKRPYREGRSQKEAELIKKEAELLAKARSDLSTGELVDLDEVERIAARDQHRRSQEDRMRTALSSVTAFQFKIKSLSSSAASPKDSDVRVELVVDGTTNLLRDGNKYRASEAKKLAESAASTVMSAARVTETNTYGGDSSLAFYLGDVKVSVEVVITVNGKEKVVATKQTGGKW
ncbi:MAG: hypothetical protein IPM63_04520 [Acidobacteriota bacterium]|nr:MAG: hypothetical protein IPM63_04520 [Acidobacteriota bacterium]